MNILRTFLAPHPLRTFILLFLLAPSVFAETITIARTGDQEPSSQGTFLHLGVPVINISGQVAFYAAIQGTNSQTADGIFFVQNGTITRIAYKGEPAPGGGVFQSFFNNSASPDGFNDDYEQNVHIPTLNNHGQVGYFAVLTNVPNSSNRAFYLDNFELVRTFSRFVGTTSFSLGLPDVSFAVNDLGQLIHMELNSSITLGSGSARSDLGYYLAGRGTNAPILPVGAAPTMLPALNNRSEIVFTGDPPEGGVIFEWPHENIYLITGGAVFDLWPRTQPTPAGDGFLRLVFPHVALNNNGEAFFKADLTNTVGGSSDNAGIFVATTNSLRQLLRENQPVPGIPGTIFDSFDYPVPNDTNQVAIIAEVENELDEDENNLFLLNDTNVTVVARQNEPSPDGNGAFIFWPESQTHVEPSLNNRGQIAIRAFFGPSGGPHTQDGILFIDTDGSKEVVVRSGQSLAGGTVASVRMLGQYDHGHDLNHSRGGRKALNDRGEVVFRATFADGGQGLFLWRRGATNPPQTSLRLTTPIRSGNASFQFSLVNPSNLPIIVLAADNLTTPLSNWTVLGAPVQLSPGNFEFLDAASTNSPRRYYMIQSP